VSLILDDAREAHMENLYGWICCQPDQEQAVAGLEDYALRDMGGYLARLNVERGVPGLIRGLVICEACDRFMKTQDVKTQDAREDVGGAL